MPIVLKSLMHCNWWISLVMRLFVVVTHFMTDFFAATRICKVYLAHSVFEAQEQKKIMFIRPRRKRLATTYLGRPVLSCSIEAGGKKVWRKGSLPWTRIVLSFAHAGVKSLARNFCVSLLISKFVNWKDIQCKP